MRVLWAIPVMTVDKSDVDPGVLGFLVVALLGLATYLLIRSMNSRIRHIDIPAQEDVPGEEVPGEDQPGEDQPGAPASGGPGPR